MVNGCTRGTKSATWNQVGRVRDLVDHKKQTDVLFMYTRRHPWQAGKKSKKSHLYTLQSCIEHCVLPFSYPLFLFVSFTSIPFPRIHRVKETEKNVLMQRSSPFVPVLVPRSQCACTVRYCVQQKRLCLMLHTLMPMR